MLKFLLPINIASMMFVLREKIHLFYKNQERWYINILDF